MMLFGFGAAVHEGTTRVAPVEAWDPQPAPMMPTQPTATTSPTPWYFQWYVLIPALLGGAWLYRRHKRKTEQQP